MAHESRIERSDCDYSNALLNKRVSAHNADTVPSTTHFSSQARLNKRTQAHASRPTNMCHNHWLFADLYRVVSRKRALLQSRNIDQPPQSSGDQPWLVLRDTDDMDEMVDDHNLHSVDMPHNLRSSIDIIYALRRTVLTLQARVLHHKTLSARWRAEADTQNNARASLERLWQKRMSSLFTRGQLSALMCRWSRDDTDDSHSLPSGSAHPLQPIAAHAQSKPEWTRQEYEMAMRMRSMCSSDGYRYLRRHLRYPLPSLDSVRRACLAVGNSGKYPGMCDMFNNLLLSRDIEFVCAQSRSDTSAPHLQSLEAAPQSVLISDDEDECEDRDVLPQQQNCVVEWSDKQLAPSIAETGNCRPAKRYKPDLYNVTSS